MKRSDLIPPFLLSPYLFILDSANKKYVDESGLFKVVNAISNYNLSGLLGNIYPVADVSSKMTLEELNKVVAVKYTFKGVYSSSHELSIYFGQNAITSVQYHSNILASTVTNVALNTSSIILCRKLYNSSVQNFISPVYYSVDYKNGLTSNFLLNGLEFQLIGNSITAGMLDIDLIIMKE